MQSDHESSHVAGRGVQGDAVELEGVQLQSTAPEPPPVNRKRSYRIWFVTGIFLSLASLLHTLVSAIISTLVYMSVLPADQNHSETFSDLGLFDDDEISGEDPVKERAGVPRYLLLFPGTAAVSSLLLLLTAYTSTYVGAVGSFRSDTCVQSQARRLARASSLSILAALPILVTVIPYRGFVFNPISWVPALIAVLITVVQLCVLRHILQHTTAVVPRNLKEKRVLFVSVLVMVVSMLQLAQTPIVAGDNSCHCKWDVYGHMVSVAQAFGSAVSAVAALMTVVVCFANFLNNSDTFTGRCVLKASICMNGIVMMLGVLMTSLVNRRLFSQNAQDLSDRKVFWAAYEQPFVSLFVLTAGIGLQVLLIVLFASQAPATEASDTERKDDSHAAPSLEASDSKGGDSSIL